MVLSFSFEPAKLSPKRVPWSLSVAAFDPHAGGHKLD